MVVGVVALAMVILTVGLGGIGNLLSPVGSAFGGLVARVASTPVPSTTPAPAFGSPTLAAPASLYTSEPTVILRGTVPAEVAGDPDYRIRLLVATGGAKPTKVKEVAIPPTATFTVPDVPLAAGANDFTATIVGKDWQSEPSAVVTYVLDTEDPKVTITSPAEGATINREAVEVSGKTQPLSAIQARNEANGSTVTATALEDGSFTLEVPLAAGPNGITVRATDPAGNEATKVLAVRRGAGKLDAAISASSYRLDRSNLPQPLTVLVAVTDPDGLPLEGAVVLLTITAPGIPPIVPSELTTDGAGEARYRTTIPKAATAGSGPITALVKTDQFGTLTVRTTLTIVD